MECERGLITPIFRLMAPSLLINDDTCHTEEGTAKTYEQLYGKMRYLPFGYYGEFTLTESADMKTLLVLNIIKVISHLMSLTGKKPVLVYQHVF